MQTKTNLRYASVCHLYHVVTKSLVNSDCIRKLLKVVRLYHRSLSQMACCPSAGYPVGGLFFAGEGTQKVVADRHSIVLPNFRSFISKIQERLS